MKRLLAVMLVLMLLPVLSAGETLTIGTQAVHPVSPTLYGLFLEDINCAVDGGLYAELLRNRSFENQNLWNPGHADHWEAWRTGLQKNATAVLEDISPIHENNPTYLHVELESGGLMRLQNQGFGGNALRGGIAVTQGESYDVSLWVRGDEEAAQEAAVEVALRDVAGNSLCTEAPVFRVTEEWRKVEAVITASESTGAVLAVTAAGKGAVDIDMVSLMPSRRVGKDWPGGGIRQDLFDMLSSLHPSFMRFPGGCVVEGTYVRENAYDWKQSVGSVEERREIANTWGGMQTMGVGFYEYFCLCEELGALPVPVVHAGLLCQARDVKDPPLTMDETKAYAQDILDLIEFATGDKDTAWGSVRASMGHPQPFDLRFVAIGNENWGSAYFSRYEVLSDRVKEVYPDITCIVAAGPVAEGNLIRDSWAQIRRSFPEDLVDEHYYMDSSWFPSHVQRYDNYPRTTKVFLGEFAAHEPVQGNRRPGTLYAALCEAAYMTGLEKNSDVVVMSCYAPLLAREGSVDWTPDLIWFDDDSVFGTPSYYVQKLFSEHRGDVLLESACDGDLFQVVTGSGEEMQVKVVNLSENTVPLTIQTAFSGNMSGKGLMLSGEKNHVNSFAKPEKVAPEEISIRTENGTGSVELPPWSLLVVRLVPET